MEGNENEDAKETETDTGRTMRICLHSGLTRWFASSMSAERRSASSFSCLVSSGVRSSMPVAAGLTWR